MPRIRTIKPEFWNDEKIAQENEGVMLTYIGTWNFSDDYGVVKANAVWLKNQIFPYKHSLRIDTFSSWLKRLEKLDALILFIHRNESFYYIRTFRKHQKIDKPSKTRNIKEEDLIYSLTELSFYLQPDGDCLKKHSANTPRTLGEYSAPEIVSSNSNHSHKGKGGELSNPQDGEEEDKKKIEHLFSESEFFDFAKFEISFADTDYEHYNIRYYYECVKNWSEGQKAKKKDWIATARNFMLRDFKDKKPVLKNDFNNAGTTKNKSGHNLSYTQSTDDKLNALARAYEQGGNKENG